MSTRVKRFAILLLTLISCVGCDQTTKYTAKQLLPHDSVIRLMDDTIRLQYTENKGAFLSLGASFSDAMRFWLFTVSVSLALGVMFFYFVLSRTLTLFQAIAMSLILGGGISNLIDRLAFRGAVVDFLNIGLGSLRTGVFNIADVFIFFGVGLLVYSGLFKGGFNQSYSDPAPE